MSASEEYLKRECLIRSIITASQHTVKINIEVDNDNHKLDNFQFNLNTLFSQRSMVAKAYIQQDDSDKKEQLIAMFSKYNENIKQILGL